MVEVILSADRDPQCPGTCLPGDQPAFQQRFQDRAAQHAAEVRTALGPVLAREGEAAAHSPQLAKLHAELGHDLSCPGAETYISPYPLRWQQGVFADEMVEQRDTQSSCQVPVT